MRPYDRPVPDHAIDSLQAEGQWRHDAWSVLNDVRPLEVREPDRSRASLGDILQLAIGTIVLGSLFVGLALWGAILAAPGAQ